MLLKGTLDLRARLLRPKTFAAALLMHACKQAISQSIQSDSIDQQTDVQPTHFPTHSNPSYRLAPGPGWVCAAKEEGRVRGGVSSAATAHKHLEAAAPIAPSRNEARGRKGVKHEAGIGVLVLHPAAPLVRRIGVGRNCRAWVRWAGHWVRNTMARLAWGRTID